MIKAKTAKQLLRAAYYLLTGIPSKHFHDVFCNGVHADNGMCEGEQMCLDTIGDIEKHIMGRTNSRKK